MSVPEASMYKNHSHSSRKYQIGSARKATDVCPKPIAHGVQCSSDKKLWFGVDRPYPTHESASLFGCHYVDHFNYPDQPTLFTETLSIHRMISSKINYGIWKSRSL